MLALFKDLKISTHPTSKDNGCWNTRIHTSHQLADYEHTRLIESMVGPTSKHVSFLVDTMLDSIGAIVTLEVVLEFEDEGLNGEYTSYLANVYVAGNPLDFKLVSKSVRVEFEDFNASIGMQDDDLVLKYDGLTEEQWLFALTIRDLALSNAKISVVAV